MKLTKSLWLVVVAAATAILVGVGAFFIAAPFAPARLVDPAVIEGWSLPASNGLAPLSDIAEDATDSAATLSTATILDIDPTSADAIRGEMRVALDALESPREITSVWPLDTDREIVSALLANDACAGDTPPSDCPAGARGTILRTIGGRVLELAANAILLV